MCPRSLVQPDRSVATAEISVRRRHGALLVLQQARRSLGLWTPRAVAGVDGERPAVEHEPFNGVRAARRERALELARRRRSRVERGRREVERSSPSRRASTSRRSRGS